MIGFLRGRRGPRPNGVRLTGPDVVHDLDDRVTCVGHEAGWHVWEVALQPAEMAALLNGTLTLGVGYLPDRTKLRPAPLDPIPDPGGSGTT
jgi:hypothetical protein